VNWELNGGENLVTLFYDKTNAIWLKLWLWIKHKASKGKATPLQAWTGPEGSRRLRPPDFKTIGT
jgi:hypothetical protein